MFTYILDIFQVEADQEASVKAEPEESSNDENSTTPSRVDLLQQLHHLHKPTATGNAARITLGHIGNGAVSVIQKPVRRTEEGFRFGRRDEKTAVAGDDEAKRREGEEEAAATRYHPVWPGGRQSFVIFAEKKPTISVKDVRTLTEGGKLEGGKEGPTPPTIRILESPQPKQTVTKRSRASR